MPRRILLLLILCSSCSLDYGDKETGQVGQSVPNVVLLNVRQTTFSVHKPAFLYQADQVEQFETKQEARLTRVKFLEFGGEDTPQTEGQADSAVYRTDTQDAQIAGNINLYSRREKTRFYAESLSWAHNDKVLRSTGEFPVTVERDAGSSLEGRGFEMNFKTGMLNFTQGVKGTISEEKNQASPSPKPEAKP